jgi:5-methylcytosine-specific restriction endonuclease McrA
MWPPAWPPPRLRLGRPAEAYAARSSAIASRVAARAALRSWARLSRPAGIRGGGGHPAGGQTARPRGTAVTTLLAMRAPSSCAEVGCWRPAVYRSRCSLHQLPSRPRPRAYRRERAKALARTRGRCADCGGVAVIGHHVIARAAGGPDTASNLIGLCASCHLARHRDPPGRHPGWS